MTTLYAVSRIFSECNSLAATKSWMELIEKLATFAGNMNHRGRLDAYLLRAPIHPSTPAIFRTPAELKDQSVIPLSVWLSSLPWEVTIGLQRHPEIAMVAHSGESSASPWISFRDAETHKGKFRGMLFHHQPHRLSHGSVNYHIGRTSFDLDIFFFDGSGNLVGSDCLLTSQRDRLVDLPRAACFCLEVIRGCLPRASFSNLVVVDSTSPANRDKPPNAPPEFASLRAALEIRTNFRRSVIVPLEEFLSDPSNPPSPTYANGRLVALKYTEKGTRRYSATKAIRLPFSSLETLGLAHVLHPHDIAVVQKM